MKDRKTTSISFGSFEMAIITLVLIGIKFTVAPDMPWPVALAPIWIPLGFVLAIVGFPMLVMVLGIICCAIFGGALIAWEFFRDIWKGGRES